MIRQTTYMIHYTNIKPFWITIMMTRLVYYFMNLLIFSVMFKNRWSTINLITFASITSNLCMGCFLKLWQLLFGNIYSTMMCCFFHCMHQILNFPNQQQYKVLVIEEFNVKALHGIICLCWSRTWHNNESGYLFQGHWQLPAT